MKLKSLLTFLLILISLSSIAQDSAVLKKARSHIKDKKEVRFSFTIEDKSELQELSNMISVDRIDENNITAYANEKEFENFLKLGKNIKVLPNAGRMKQAVDMATSVAQMENWDKYPTYETYVAMMQKFANDYPDLCKLIKIGTTQDGRELLVVKISDNVSQEEAEPEFFYSAAIHGDETTGFLIMLRYIHHLLSNYSSDTEIANIVNSMEIYINPNANPDGTYKGGNASIKDATRSNANGKDLNRSYPDPKTGNPTSYEKETQAIMDFYETHNFVMSATFHDLYELVNYPWDAWTGGEPDNHIHADNDWFKKISRDFATSCQTKGFTDYFTQQNNGITNGGDWYVVHGGKQDYATYYRNCRDITIEMSSHKVLSTDELTNYWNYSYEAITGYIKEVLYGFNGTIKNEDGNPVVAKIEITSHDKDNSFIITDANFGDYYRPIAPGTYEVTYSANGYTPQTHTVEVTGYKTTTVKNITLIKDGSSGNIVNVKGMIKDNATNSMILNATIRLVGSTIQPVQSNAQGKYTITGVEEGTHTFKISHPDYTTIEVSKSISPTNTTFDFGMDKNTGTGINAPTDLMASNTSQTAIKLTWTDNSNNETGFAIERKSGNDSFTKIATVGENIMMYEDKNLPTNIEYSYKVKAVGGSNNSEYWKIWIDLNNDKDFEDKDELVFDAGSASSTTVQGKINIPSSITNLTTRMRISMKNESAPDSCESFDAGEVEDYTVIINRSSSINSTSKKKK